MGQRIEPRYATGLAKELARKLSTNLGIDKLGRENERNACSRGADD